MKELMRIAYFVVRMLRDGSRGLLIGASLGVLLLSAGCGGRAETWEEDFSTGDAWTLSSDAAAQVEVADGALQIEVFEPGVVAWATSEPVWDNVRVQVVATQVAGPPDNEYGVLVRMEEDERFYAFSISGDGYMRAALYEEGIWTLLGPDWTLHEAIRQGKATNQLEVVAQGEAMDFIVNGETVLHVDDATLSRGHVGVYAGAFTEGGVVIAFDDLRVEPLP